MYLIEQDGSKVDGVESFLLTNDRYYYITENQWLQITPTGKRIELWETIDDGRELRVAYWNINSLIAYYVH